MRRLLRIAVRVYPARWRERYDDELRALFDDLADARPSDILDMLAWAVRARVRHLVDGIAQRGATAMLERHAPRLAGVGLIIMTPTLVFVTLAVLKYIVGVAAPFDAVEPAVTPFVTHPVGEALVILAPYVAFVVAVVPTIRLDLGWRDARISGSVALSAPIVNLLVACLAAAVAAVMLAYWFAENL